MQPTLFRIPTPWGELPVFSYGFLMMIGFIAAIAYASWRARREGLDPNYVLDIGLYCLVFGILGSRAMYYWEFFRKKVPVVVAQLPMGEKFDGGYDFMDTIEVVRQGQRAIDVLYLRYLSFSERPWYTFFYIHEGGLVFYGGLIVAAAAVVCYLVLASRRERLAGRPAVPVLRFCDIIACAVPLAISFARIGCFLNGCCWGRRVADGGHALLALQFPRGSPAWESHVKSFGLSEAATQCYPVHGTQLYEWGGALLIVAAMAVYWRWHKRDGQLFALLAALYGPLRYVIEGFREHDAGAERTHAAGWLVDPIAGAAMTNSQLVSVGMFAVGIIAFAIASRRGPVYAPRGGAPEPVGGKPA